MSERKPYPSDVSDDEWAFVALYLTLMTDDRVAAHLPLREVFNGLRYVVRGGIPWRLMPNDLPPWHTVYQQTQRWLKAGVFEAMVHDLREVLRVAADRNAQPSAAVFASRTLQASPESGERAGYDGAKRHKGSKTHLAVDTLGHLLALVVTAADERHCAQVGQLAEAVQEATGQSTEVAFVDQGYTGAAAEQSAADQGIRLEVVKLPDAKKGFVLLLRRWVVERSFGWTARFRRLARDYERLPETLRGLHLLAFAILMAHQFFQLMAHLL
ncbi:MAG: IS5 family transposase [Chloroflexi bacterium]|nr:IS5 family transposase [Chloroflexota bacterium]